MVEGMLSTAYALHSTACPVAGFIWRMEDRGCEVGVVTMPGHASRLMSADMASPVCVEDLGQVSKWFGRRGTQRDPTQALENRKTKHRLERIDFVRFLRHLDALQDALAMQRRALGETLGCPNQLPTCCAGDEDTVLSLSLHCDSKQ